MSCRSRAIPVGSNRALPTCSSASTASNAKWISTCARFAGSNEVYQLSRAWPLLLFHLSAGDDYPGSHRGTHPLGTAKMKTINLLHPPTKGKLMANITVQIGSATLAAGKTPLGPFDVDEFAESAVFILDSTQHLNSGVEIILKYEVTMTVELSGKTPGKTSEEGACFSMTVFRRHPSGGCSSLIRSGRRNNVRSGCPWT